MNFPNDLRYSTTHEWVRLEDGEAVIGVTAYASEEMGDIVYVELPEEGEKLEKDAAFGVLESVKATADLYSPLSGEVVDINTPLEDAPEVINEDPYIDGWMIRIKMSDPAELDGLMSTEAYQEFIEQEQE